MEFSLALDLGRAALVTTLLMSAPILGAGVIVGLVISLIQAVTQIQDQTISIVPKIVAMVVVAVLLIPWLTQRMVEYSQALFAGT
jgi:flagellar biosynthetic protein FliQ